mmetsp:Transcript_15410/g.22936  ORF Transcript_15410/g.22936 Transcript_15410/m.22936 type:complete len:908 (-) Transcript_15410:318-3041(-)
MSKVPMIPTAASQQSKSDLNEKEQPKEGATTSFARLNISEGGAVLQGGPVVHPITSSKGEEGTMTRKNFEKRDTSTTKKSSSLSPNKKNGSMNHVVLDGSSNVAGKKIAVVERHTGMYPSMTASSSAGDHTKTLGEDEKTKIPSCNFSTKSSSTGLNLDGIFSLPSGSMEKLQENPSISATTVGVIGSGVIPQTVAVIGGHPILPSAAQRTSAVAVSPGKIMSGAGGGGMALNGAGPGGEHASPNGANNSPKNEASDIIDSALLSALSDQRERKGLLRLEQTLVDFMKERNAGYIEVGGPNNSIVINGQSGGGSRNMMGVGDAPQDGVLPQQLLLVNDGQQQYGAGNGGRGGRQTSFQRLCLHRLADRFNIVREPASTPLQTTDVDGYNVGGGALNGSGGGNVSYPPGLIRLVKVKNSRIPSKLLIDLDLSSYSNSNGHRNGRGLINPDSIGITEDSNPIRGGIPESLASYSNTENTKSFQKQPPKKMMIMKRSSSGLGSSGSLKSKGDNGKGGRNKGKGLKGKNLSDKEKAYEEARARIFNETQSSASTVGEAQNQETSDLTIPPFETPPRSASPSSSTRSSETGTAVSEEQQNNATSKSTTEKPQSQDINEITNGTDAVRIRRENPFPSSSFVHPSYQQQQLPAAAATGGAVSKVTWRNRRQEENDPDFRRRGTVRVAATGAVGLGAPSTIAVVNPMHSGIHMTSSAAHYGGPMAPAPSAAAGNFQGIPTMVVQQPQQQQHIMTNSTKNGNVYPSQQSQQHYYSSQSNAASSGGSGGTAQSGSHHRQQQQQVQAATAVYYAQQHAAAAAFYAQPHHHHRSHSPNVSGGGVLRHQHHMQQSRGNGNGGYGGSGGGGQYISHGGRHWGKHASDVGSSGNGRAADSNTQQATTTSANVYNMEEFPALR